jgi:Protein of unknown function (DUF3795)
MDVAIDSAYCGLDCVACPAFHAAERLTMAERKAVADKWTIEFGGEFKAEEIDCVGCTHDGRHIPHCESQCEIRRCGMAMAVATCAECADYGCAKLAGLLADFPEARANLEARRLA